MNRSEVLAELVTLIETADANDKTIAEAIYDAGFRKAEATTCPGHGRSECVSCCWPKGEAPASFVVTLPKGGSMWDDEPVEINRADAVAAIIAAGGSVAP